MEGLSDLETLIALVPVVSKQKTVDLQALSRKLGLTPYQLCRLLYHLQFVGLPDRKDLGFIHIDVSKEREKTLLHFKLLSGWRVDPWGDKEWQVQLSELLTFLTYSSLFLSLPGAPKEEIAQLREKVVAFLKEEMGLDFSRLAEVFPLVVAKETDPKITQKLIEGIEEERFLQILYYSLYRGSFSKKEILPYLLLFYRGSLYLLGEDKKHPNELRSYAVERIYQVSLGEKEGKRKKELEEEALKKRNPLFFFKEGFVVEVLFSKKVAEEVKARWEDWGRFREKKDGSLHVQFPTLNIKGVCWQILPYGPHARVLSPPEAIVQMQELLSTLPQLIDG